MSPLTPEQKTMPSPKQEALAALGQALAIAEGNALPELGMALMQAAVEHAARKVELIEETMRPRRAKKEPAP